MRYIDDLVLYRKNTTDSYVLQDANWNVVAVVNTSGVVQERYTYNAFGKLNIFDAGFTARSTSTVGITRTFTGQVFDAESGLMLYRNRVYHPTLGRFIQRDPIGYEAGDDNLYRYVGNRVMDYSDPSGEDWLSCMNDCLKHNDPIDQALANAIAALASRPIKKATALRIAEWLYDQKWIGEAGKKSLQSTIAGIKHSIRMGGKYTSWPSNLSLYLRSGGRSALRMLGRIAGPVVYPATIAYGLALAGVETHCAGICSTLQCYDIDEYDPSLNLIDTQRERGGWNIWK